jgi:predicted amidohydrolase YtcJ
VTTRTAHPETWRIRSARLLGRQGLWDIEVVGASLGGTSPSGLAARELPGVDLGGRLLLPGFVDCHVHLLSMARHRGSLDLVAAGVKTIGDLREVLTKRMTSTAMDDWLRAVNFDEVAMTGGWIPTRTWLDAISRDRPIRVQHGSQRLNVLNTAAIRMLGQDDATAEGHVFGGVRQVDGSSGRGLVDALREGVAAVCRDLVAAGVTGIQDAGPHNGRSDFALMGAMLGSRALTVRCAAMVGAAEIDQAGGAPVEIPVSHVKLECLENESRLEALIEVALRARHAGLGIALHAITETEVAMAVAVLGEVNERMGRVRHGFDRIEHAGQASDELVAAVADSGAAVVANPSFIALRGARYRALLPAAAEPELHRLRSWRTRGIDLAIASDAPVTPCRPLDLIRDAASRRTPDGLQIGPAEALSAAEAVEAITRTPRMLLGQLDWAEPLGAGSVADLVAIDGPLETRPATCRVAMTVIGGQVRFADAQFVPEVREWNAA